VSLLKNLLFVLLFSLSLNSAYAKDTAEIFTGSTSSSLIFTKSNYSDYKALFVADVGYDHAFSNGLQIGTNAGLSIESDFNTISLMVGPTYNFNNKDLENSFYAAFKFGVLLVNYSGYHYSNAVISTAAGKRFKLAEGICYSPDISVEKVLGHNVDDPSISFNIVKFSLVF
jgi:hypothetical protein